MSPQRALLQLPKAPAGPERLERVLILLLNSYKLFKRRSQKRMEKILDEHQPQEQAGFRRRNISTIDHILYPEPNTFTICNGAKGS